MLDVRVMRSGWIFIGLLLLALVACAPNTLSRVGPLEPPSTVPESRTTAPDSTVTPKIEESGPFDWPEFAPAFIDYWRPPTEFYGSPTSGGTLRVSYGVPLDSANVWGSYNPASAGLRALVHNKLLEVDPYDSTRIIPDLARGWKVHDDGQGITFFLHSGVQWQNGLAFSCEDVRFGLETLTSGEGISSPETSKELNFLGITRASCEQDLILDLRFNKPAAPLINILASPAASVFNKSWFQTHTEGGMTFDLSVGTGPFVWTQGQEIGSDQQLFEKNLDYFKRELPYLDRVILTSFSDERAQQAAMLARQIDWQWVNNFDQYDIYVEHDQIQTVIRNTANHQSLWVNKRNPPFDNVRVREAIWALDRVAAVEKLARGHGTVRFLMLPGSRWDLDELFACGVDGWCSNPQGPDLHRETAGKILQGEGFPFDQTFTLTVGEGAQDQKVAEFVQDQLRVMGITIELDTLGSDELQERITNGTWGDFIIRRESIRFDNSTLAMEQFFRCDAPENLWSPGTKCDETTEQLLDRVLLSTSVEQLAITSDELQLHVMEQYKKLPLYWEQEAAAFWPDIRGYVHHSSPEGPFQSWEHVWIDPKFNDAGGFAGQISGVPGGLRVESAVEEDLPALQFARQPIPDS